MSDANPNFDSDAIDNENLRGYVKSLEDQAKNAPDPTEVASLQRTNAFLMAGVPVGSADEATSFQAGIFARGYDGDLSDTGAIAQAWEAFAQPATPEPPANPETPSAEEPPPPADRPLPEGAGQAIGTDLAIGGIPGPGEADPREEAISIAQGVMAKGGKKADALGAAINKLANAAHQGHGAVRLDRNGRAAPDRPAAPGRPGPLNPVQ